MLLIAVAFAGCKKEDDLIYGVEETLVVPPNANKNKLKTEAQYLAILYANLFQKALSANQAVELADIIESIGDKELAHEVIISNFMNMSDIKLPDNDEMRSDIDGFIEDTYKRFFVRPPSELEKTYFRNYIESNENVTPELVYFSFALSDEYLFY